MNLVSEHPFGAGRLIARMHRLTNGLKVLTCADPSAPVFAYQTWYAVGSRHERPGITGLARNVDRFARESVFTLVFG